MADLFSQKLENNYPQDARRIKGKCEKVLKAMYEQNGNNTEETENLKRNQNKVWS